LARAPEQGVPHRRHSPALPAGDKKQLVYKNRNLITDDAFDDDGLNRSIDGLAAFPSLAMCSAMSSYFSYGKTPEI